MRSLIVCAGLIIAWPAFSQSKKELRARVAELEGRVMELTAEVKELRKPVEVDLNDSIQQVSYSFGVVLGQNFQNTGLDSLDMDVFLTAMQDVLADKPLKVERKEAEASMQRYMQQTMMKRSAIAKAQSQ